MHEAIAAAHTTQQDVRGGVIEKALCSPGEGMGTSFDLGLSCSQISVGGLVWPQSITDERISYQKEQQESNSRGVASHFCARG
jgi:hypothetical protein